MPTKQPANKSTKPRFTLFPFSITLTAVLFMTGWALAGAFGPALGIGVAAGALLFVRGTVIGGRLGNARKVGRSEADMCLRVGACLALAGIAAGGQGHNPPFTETQRVLIGLGQGLASLLAVWLAGHWVTQTQTAKETEAAHETSAKLL